MTNANNIYGFIKEQGNTILSQVLIYAFILIFPAFGPVSTQIIGVYNGVIMGSAFLGVLIIGVSLPPMGFEAKRGTINFYLVLGSIITCIFPFVGFGVQIAIISVLGWVTGRYTMYWCQLFFFKLINKHYGITIGALLFSSYFLLYISNAIVPSMPPKIAAIWACLFLAGGVIFNPIAINGIRYGILEKKAVLPYKNLTAILVVFITAGTTYAGIYPSLKEYSGYERFYNVLPFLFAALAAGIISERIGRRILIYFGVGCLGLAFIFNLITPGLLTYFLIQTFLQIGWAFLDAYAWITGADIAKKSGQPMVTAYFVAAFLLGTFLGSVISASINQSLGAKNEFLNAIITYLPLFTAIFIIPFLPETREPTQSKDMNAKSLVSMGQKLEEKQIVDNEVFSELTPREKEVIVLLLEDITNEEISQRLFISHNTLKKHARNIYSKMQVSNKRELKSKVREL